MHRKLFRLFALVCLLLCIAISILWPVSYSEYHPHCSFHFFQGNMWLSASRGKAELLWSTWLPLSPGEKPSPYPKTFWNLDWPLIGVSGVYVPRVKDPAHFKGANCAITFPLGLLLVFAGILPLVWRRFKQQKRPSPEHCRVCDYDLRATPDRCPECGTVFP